MILKNFFTPRWRHPNPQIRRQALAELANDDEILAQIARQDPEPELRLLAMERITDIALLEHAAHTDLDQKVREHALQRLREVLAGTDPHSPSLTERLIWLGRSDDTELLTYLARHGKEATLRSTILERITDEEVLAATAVADADARVRVLAASRLQNRLLLERVVKLARNRDKGVYRVVQERLAAIITAEERPQRLRQLRLELCAEVETLVRRSQWRDASPLERLAERWTALEGVADPEVMARFTAAVTQARRSLAADEERRREKARLEEALISLRAEKTSLCLALENLATDLTQRVHLESDDAVMVRSLLRTIENGWAQSATLPTLEETRFSTRFQEAQRRTQARLGELLHRVEQLTAGRAQCTRLEQALTKKNMPDEALLKDWQREWQALQMNECADDAEGNALIHRFQAALTASRERVREERERGEQNLTRAEVAVTELEQALEQGLLKVAVPALNVAQAAVSDLTTSTRASALKSRLEKNAAAVHQLQEWQRWGNDRERERLCGEAEALVGVDDTPERLATHIRELREVWNRLGAPGPQEREAMSLSMRFNTACEAAFEPCRMYFAEQTRQRNEMRKIREMLIARAEEFTNAADWTTMDWQAADDFLQEMREAWRNAGTVDRRDADRLQERFTAALEPLHREIRREHRRNLKTKEALVIRAEAIRAEADARVAVATIKRLQLEWKTLGHAPRRQEQELWKRLRAVADEIFARRHAQTAAQEAERQAARAAREALCEQAEALAQRQGVELLSAASERSALEQQWAALPPLGREDTSALDNRLRKAFATYHEAVAAWTRQQAWDTVATLVARGMLCIDLDALAESATEDLSAALTTARQQWQALGAECDPALAARFERAYTRATLPPAQRQTELPTLAHNEIEALETLCVRLEVLIEVESPPESAAVRFAYQVNRLAVGFGQGQEEIINTAQRRTQFMALLQTWYLNGPLPAELRTRFAARLQRVLTAARAKLI